MNNTMQHCLIFKYKLQFFLKIPFYVKKNIFKEK